MPEYDSYRSAATGDRGFNISDFRSHRDKVGIIRSHDFHLEIPWPLALIDTTGQIGMHRNIELMVDQCNFPATGANIHKLQRYSYGATETRPTSPQFSDLSLTVMTDQYSIIWQFLHRWMQLTVNYDFNRFQIQDAYEISYSDEYTVDMFLYIYNPQGTLVRKVGFRRAFPTSIGDIPFNWARMNEMVKIPVNFAFTDWSEESIL